MFNSSLSTSIWMGELDPTMDEPFISNLFHQFGEVIIKITMLHSKSFGMNGQSCFLEFSDVDTATRVLQRLNGKAMPGKPGKRFHLTPASYDHRCVLQPEFSLYVSDLSWNVDEFVLFNFFKKKYDSVRSAKVINDNNGRSRGYGFIRFSEEKEQLKALIEMQHMTGLGRRPIKVSLAKKPDSSAAVSEPVPSHHYTWGGVGHMYHEPSAHHHHHIPPEYEYGVSSYHHDRLHQAQVAQPTQPIDEDAEILEDPVLEINVGKENREYIDSSESFFAALENSRWMPLDNIMSEIPD